MSFHDPIFDLGFFQINCAFHVKLFSENLDSIDDFFVGEMRIVRIDFKKELLAFFVELQ